MSCDKIEKRSISLSLSTFELPKKVGCNKSIQSNFMAANITKPYDQYSNIPISILCDALIMCVLLILFWYLTTV